MSKSDKQNITDVWDITTHEITNIHDELLDTENDLMKKHQGSYFDYQLLDHLFPEYSDSEKARIFLYGQWVHEQFYKKN